MESTLDRVMVAFEGEGSGVAELSWGQAENWSAIVAQKTWIPLGGIRPLDPATTLDEITEDLRYLMSRYQSIRTRLRLDGERPLQVVAASGEVPLEIADVPDGADAGEFAEELAHRYRSTDLDFTTEWPVRMAVVRQRGVLTHQIALLSHFVTDAGGAMVMLGETAIRETAPVDGLEPLAQAQWQRSEPGRRQNEAALRYWEKHLRAIPPRRFDPPAVLAQPRYWQAEFTSPALLAATRAITERTGADSSPVLLAIYAVAVHRVTGAHPVVFRPMVSNRFRPGITNVVCTAAQAGLCVIDVAGLGFDDALARAQKSALAAYKYAYFDYFAVADLMARVALERGTDIDLSCFFNDRRGMSRTPHAGPAPTRAQIEAARERSLFRWVVSQDAPSFEELFVHVDDVPDTMQITMHMDGHRLTLADGEAVLRAMEQVAVEAVTA